jgi:o-succinylbenzoate---CoA ligase
MQVEAWLERAARTAPRTTAIQTVDAHVSYAELYAAARAGADELRELGAQAGERVAIALPPGLAFAEALHACMLLGAVAVPIDLRLSPSEREHLCVGAKAIVAERLAEGAPVAGGDDRLALAGGHELDAVCAVLHTSGTTSAPRPIELTYGNFLWSALGSGVALGVDPQERWLCALPLSHVGGLSILLRSAIYATTAVVHERFETDRVLRALSEQRITLVSLVSTTLARLLDAGLRDPPQLRFALTGGGPIPSVLVQRAREAGVPVAETYGLTEACSQVTTCGPPLFCTRMRLSEEGEILVAGPTVARCAAEQDGFLHTGDLGRFDERGFLEVAGRISDTIVSGGENVAPIEVEAVLESFPGVSEAAVFGCEDPHWGEAVSAIVVVGPGERLDEQALREHCAQRLARFKVPKRFALVSEPLPRTRSGKLLRRELRREP